MVDYGDGVCPDDEDNSLHHGGCVNSAYAAHSRHQSIVAIRRALQADAERKRRAEDATIELNNEAKQQNEFLRAQVKSERKWKWVMFAVAVVSIVVNLLVFIRN